MTVRECANCGSDDLRMVAYGGVGGFWRKECANCGSTGPFAPKCGFCKGEAVTDAASWLDGKPRPPAPCPRCGKVAA